MSRRQHRINDMLVLKVRAGRAISTHLILLEMAQKDIDTKVYFILDRPALIGDLDPASLAEDAVRKFDADASSSFSAGLSAAILYFERWDLPMTVHDVEMLAIDCKALSQSPRVKLYAHSHVYSFETLEHVLTMGGLVSQHEQTKSCLVLLEDLWRALFSDVLQGMYFKPTFAMIKANTLQSEQPPKEWKSLQLQPVVNLNNRRPESI